MEAGPDMLTELTSKRPSLSEADVKPTRPTEIESPSSGLIEIQVAPGNTWFELELRGGQRLRVPASFDAPGLSRLLDVLEAR